MARTGRPKKPAAVKRVQGTQRADRANDSEPVPLGRLGPPPDELDAEAGTRWDWLAQTAWWLTDADRGAAELYCRRWSLYLAAHAQVLEDGLVWTRKDGYSQPSGAAVALSNAEKALLESGARLGLDPTSRTQIAAPEKKKTDLKKKYGL